MTTHRFVAVLLLVSLAGCTTTGTAAVRIDGSSPEAFDASWKALEATLNPEQQAKLNTAIVQIGTTKALHEAMKQPPKEPTTSFGPATLRSDLDGKTFDEIIKAGDATGTTIVCVEHHGGPHQQQGAVAASK